MRGERVIPSHIDALPKTAAGIPVSYTVAWSDELEATLAEDPVLGQVIDQPDLRTGVPLLNRTHVTRTRRCVREGLCQICAEPVGAERWLADLRIHIGEELRVSADWSSPLIVDAWTCDDCLPFSLVSCPALIRRREQGLLRLLRVEDWHEVPTPERPTYLTDVPFGPVGYVKIAPVLWEWVKPDDLLLEEAA